jgi:hypothetical protein
MTLRARPDQDLQVADDGPIILWRDDEIGLGREGLVLTAGVCPIPGCPVRHMMVDGFRVDDSLQEASLDEGRLRTDHRPGGREPTWAFAVSIGLEDGTVEAVEEAAEPGALAWLRRALDARLLGVLRERFERDRARVDAGLAVASGTGFIPPLGTAAPTRYLMTFELPSPGRRPSSKAYALPAGVPMSAMGGLGREVDLRRPARRADRLGRNDLCPCGSGKKYKRCCLGTA